MSKDELRILIKKHCSEIKEHCDSVQILVTRLEDDGATSGIKVGAGDYYARLGHAREFILEDKSAIHYSMKPPEPPDDNEAWKSGK